MNRLSLLATLTRGVFRVHAPRSCRAGLFPALLACLVAVGAAAPARAGVVIVPQTNDDGWIEFSWSGSLDLTGASSYGQVGGMALSVFPAVGFLTMASTDVFNTQWAVTGVGAGPFGSGTLYQDGYNVSANTTGNASFSVSNSVTLPTSYVSGSPLQGILTFTGVTYADMQFIPGTYTWTLLGSGDTVVMEIAAVPEIDPAGMGSVLALVTGGLGLIERRRRKTA